MDRELPRANLQVPFDLAAPVKADWDTGSYYALRSSVLTGLFDVQGSKELFTAGTARNVADDLHVPVIVATLQSTSTFFEPYNTVTIVSINLKELTKFIIDVVQGGSVQVFHSISVAITKRRQKLSKPNPSISEVCLSSRVAPESWMSMMAWLPAVFSAESSIY
jgi:hypothetical protein